MLAGRTQAIEMQQEFDHPPMRYFIGDVRDGERLRTAPKEIDS